MQDAGMHIRIEQELRDEFVAACRSENLPASQVIRQFMKKYDRQVLHRKASHA